MKASGEKEPWSMFKLLSLYSLFFSFSFYFARFGDSSISVPPGEKVKNPFIKKIFIYPLWFIKISFYGISFFFDSKNLLSQFYACNRLVTSSNFAIEYQLDAPLRSLSLTPFCKSFHIKHHQSVPYLFVQIKRLK